MHHRAGSCPVLSSALAPAPSIVARHIVNTDLLNETSLTKILLETNLGHCSIGETYNYKIP